MSEFKYQWLIDSVFHRALSVVKASDPVERYPVVRHMLCCNWCYGAYRYAHILDKMTDEQRNHLIDIMVYCSAEDFDDTVFHYLALLDATNV